MTAVQSSLSMQRQAAARGPTACVMYSIRQYALLYSSLLGSMLAGASTAHAVLRPDLRLPLPPKKDEVA